MRRCPLSDDQTPESVLALRRPIERRNTYELVADSLLALVRSRLDLSLARALETKA